jgi:hypothetical protein
MFSETEPQPAQEKPEIILHPSTEQKQEPERDFSVTIQLPKNIGKDILGYIDPQWSNWYRELKQFDYEQRVDAKRAEQELPPINPGRKHHDRNKMQENFEQFDRVKRQYAEPLFWGGTIVPLTLIEFLDWRIGHKQMHVKKAQEEENNRDEQKSQKELNKLEKWKSIIVKKCPVIGSRTEDTRPQRETSARPPRTERTVNPPERIIIPAPATKTETTIPAPPVNPPAPPVRIEPEIPAPPVRRHEENPQPAEEQKEAPVKRSIWDFLPGARERQEERQERIDIINHELDAKGFMHTGNSEIIKLCKSLGLKEELQEDKSIKFFRE